MKPGSEFFGEFKSSIEDALAASLRRVMEMSGSPIRREYRDLSLYDLHMRQWHEAKRVLKAYDDRLI